MPVTRPNFWKSAVAQRIQENFHYSHKEINIIASTFPEQRTSNGTLRKFFIADKKTFSVSWDMLPSYRDITVDGAWGAEDIRTFYDTALGQGVFKIKINSFLIILCLP